MNLKSVAGTSAFLWPGVGVLVVGMVVVEEMVEEERDEGEREREGKGVGGRAVGVRVLEEGEQRGRQKQELRYALDRMRMPYTSLHS